MGIVGDRRGKRAPPKPGARDQPHADPPGAEVPLGHRELDEVTVGIGHDVAVDDRRLALERLGDDLVGDEADRASGAAVPRDREVRRDDRLEADGMAHPLRHLGGRHVVDATAALEDEVGDEPLEVGEDQEVSHVARRHGPVLLEPVPLRGMEGRHQDRVRRVDPGGDGVAHHAVDMAVVGDVLRVAIVRAECDPAGAVLLDERQEGLQVARHRRLPDQEPDARP